mmetsp:Transcript_42116/g.98221  ORF Transcript_42116/g.98221 Transcript_42116/m.98221 type:complete len:247 (-) Transcript_42116:117-857(-)
MVACVSRKTCGPPCAPSSHPRATPPDCEDLCSFMLPPAAMESFDDASLYNFLMPPSTFEAPSKCVQSSLACCEEERNAGPMIDSPFYKAMKASRQILPKEVRCVAPKKPRLAPSLPAVDLSTIPDFTLPDALETEAGDTPHGLENEWCQAKQATAAAQKGTSAEQGIFWLLSEGTEAFTGLTELSVEKLEKWGVQMADGRRRASTCSTTASVLDMDQRSGECLMTKVLTSSSMDFSAPGCPVPVSL